MISGEVESEKTNSEFVWKKSDVIIYSGKADLSKFKDELMKRSVGVAKESMKPSKSQKNSITL
jgi:hypothetical protein